MCGCVWLCTWLAGEDVAHVHARHGRIWHKDTHLHKGIIGTKVGGLIGGWRRCVGRYRRMC